ncbi:MAG: hypothetical protein KDJ28_09710 [Candidatus Competibacteraceae bacterium]|nr:hypothetical protein [Candidatus Competibacteraceae bacterium]
MESVAKGRWDLLLRRRVLRVARRYRTTWRHYVAVRSAMVGDDGHAIAGGEPMPGDALLTEGTSFDRDR